MLISDQYARHYIQYLLHISSAHHVLLKQLVERCGTDEEKAGMQALDELMRKQRIKLEKLDAEQLALAEEMERSTMQAMKDAMGPTEH